MRSLSTQKTPKQDPRWRCSITANAFRRSCSSFSSSWPLRRTTRELEAQLGFNGQLWLWSSFLLSPLTFRSRTIRTFCLTQMPTIGVVKPKPVNTECYVISTSISKWHFKKGKTEMEWITSTRDTQGVIGWGWMEGCYRILVRKKREWLFDIIDKDNESLFLDLSILFRRTVFVRGEQRKKGQQALCWMGRS